MSLRHHEIAEAGHRILNPFTEAKLRLLGEVAGVVAGSRVLDLACGKGEMLCRWAEWFGSSGIGVDLSPVFLGAAVARAAELGVGNAVHVPPGRCGGPTSPTRARSTSPRASARRGSAAAWPAPSSCCGRRSGEADGSSSASRTGSSHRRTRRSRRAGSRPTSSCPSGHARPVRGRGSRLRRDGARRRRHLGPLRAAQWRTIAAWLDANPGDADHDAMRTFLDDGRRTYLRWGRRYLGWGVFVTRPR